MVKIFSEGAFLFPCTFRFHDKLMPEKYYKCMRNYAKKTLYKDMNTLSENIQPYFAIDAY